MSRIILWETVDYCHNTVDVQLEIEASESLAGTTAYCSLIHDCIVEYVPFTREEGKLV